MSARCSAPNKALLTVIALTFCAIVYLKYCRNYGWPKSALVDKVSRYVEVARPEITASLPGRPYLIPSDEILGKMNESRLFRIYWRYVNALQILCRNQSRLGSFGDGGKEVCLDGIYKPKKPCIVYSFGSNFQFDFDVDAHDSFGCDVYTFDPSMDIHGKGKNRAIPQQIKFKEAGLAGKDHVRSNSWQMKTLKTILKENGHQKKVVDIIKMDVEGGEWDSIPNILESGAYKQVKQLLVEFHFGHFMSKPGKVYWGDMDMAKQLRVLRMLYQYGFRIFTRERVIANLWKMQEPPHKVITPQNEICFVNTAFLQS